MQQCYVHTRACLNLFIKFVKVADGLLFVRQKLIQVFQLPILNDELRNLIYQGNMCHFLLMRLISVMLCVGGWIVMNNMS